MTEDGDAAGVLAEHLCGRALYGWQKRLLLGYFQAGLIPDAVDIPTGLGKTTVMTLWLAALAQGARLPRRLVYVVDRRAVVDQATTEADALARAIGDGTAGDLLIAGAREQLRLLAGQTLPVSTLRGQHLDNRLWMADPSSPAIIVGTVDMIGSRLLFSGYGVSPRMRPVHAGLLGVDALVVIDEAHLVPPFEALVRSIERMRQEKQAPGLPPMRAMSLSATGRTLTDNVFRLGDPDWQEPRVKARLDAPKHLRLLQEAAPKELAAALAGRAWDLAQPSAAVLVFCNSRKVAAETASILTRRWKDSYSKEPPLIELLVGERRVFERTRLDQSPAFNRFRPRANSGSQPVGPDRPAFLVATSAGEVGVDLDADHMVCDLVAWERMVQRLGRVNRRTDPAPRAVIEVIPAALDVDKDEAEDKAAAERLSVLRAPFESQLWPAGPDGARDASPGALYRLKHDPEMTVLTAAAETPEPLRPGLTPALVDAWAMTSLLEHSGRPDVAPWLRGWVDDDPQSRIVWRREFPLRANKQDDRAEIERARRRDLEAFFEAAPPHMGEMLEAPTYRAVEILRKRADAMAKASRDDADSTSRTVAVALSLAGTVESTFTVDGLRKVNPKSLFRSLAGRTVVVDARLGGLDQNGLLDVKSDLEPQTLDQDFPAWLAGLGEPAKPSMVGFRVRRVAASEQPEAHWRIQFRWPVDPDAESPDRAELRVEVWRGGQPAHGDSAISRVEQKLTSHCEEVVQVADRICAAMPIDPELRQAVAHAARAHDLGKGREQWQRAMNAPKDGTVYAKTRGGGMPRLLVVDGETYRHEFGSTCDADSSPVLSAQPPETRDLILHLIASHHGLARPVIAPLDPARPPSACRETAQEIARRFLRLHQRWGPWELAWWESLLRAADWQASSGLDAGGSKGAN